MVSVCIDGEYYSAQKTETVLAVCKRNGIYIPTLCYLKEINEASACKVCVVEIEGENRLVPACRTIVKEGMRVVTNSRRVLEARKISLSLILSRHKTNCEECVRGGECELRRLVNEFDVSEIFPQNATGKLSDEDYPLIRDGAKCVGCLRCVGVCDKIQSLGVWDLVGTGRLAKVGTANGNKIEDEPCVLCGQCIANCPTGALSERDDTEKVEDLLRNKDKISVAIVSPAAAEGFGVGLTGKAVSEKKLVSALKSLGFRYVFGTGVAADKIIEEYAREIKERKGKSELPLVSAFCPSWRRLSESDYPELKDALSLAISPEEMLGGMVKGEFAQSLGVAKEKITCVAITSCFAEKGEKSDLFDAVITVRELERWAKKRYVKIGTIPEKEFDAPYNALSGKYSAFIRSGDVVNALSEEIKSANGGKDIRAVSVCGLSDVKKLMDEIKHGKKDIDFIEVAACPHGCAFGGGQPIKPSENIEL